MLARVDERLIHGQIINEWVSLTNPTHLLIVDEALVEDEFMSNIYKALAPLWLEVQILSPARSADFLSTLDGKDRVLLLAKTPQPFEALMHLGVPLSEVTLADKAYRSSKIPVPPASKHAVNALLAGGVRVIARNFPSDEARAMLPYKL